MKDYTVKTETLQYYFTELMFKNIPGQGMVRTIDCMIEMVSRMMVEISSKRLWTRDNEISKIALANWYNGYKLMHFCHARRLAQEDKLEVKPPPTDYCRKRLKTLRSFIDLIRVVVCDSDLDISNIGEISVGYEAQSGGICMKNCISPECNVFVKSYTAQGFSDFVVKPAYWCAGLPGRFIRWWATRQIKTAVLDGFNKIAQPIVEAMNKLWQMLEELTKPIFDKIATLWKDHARKIKKWLIVIGLYLSLSFLLKKLIPDYSTEIFVALATFFFIECLEVPISEKDIEHIAPETFTYQDESTYECQVVPSIAAGLMGLTTSVIFGTFSTKHATQFNSLMTSGNHVSKYIEFFITHARDIIDWAYASYTGKPFFRESEHLAAVRESFNEFSKILVDYESNNVFSREPGLADKIIEFYSKVVKEDEFVRVSQTLTPVEKTRWATLLIQIRHWYQAAKNSKQTQKPRQVPLWINITGEPGIGKTSIIEPLASGIFSKVRSDRGYETSDRFERKVQNEYWDGYKQQWMVTYDDLYQILDPVSRMTTTMELIHAVNSNSYPLHMAGVEDKSSTYLDSKLIITTSNVEGFPVDIGISAPEALRRRCHIPVKLIRRKNLTDIQESWEYYYSCEFDVKTAMGETESAFERPLDPEEFLAYCVKKYKQFEIEAETISKPPSKEYWDGIQLPEFNQKPKAPKKMELVSKENVVRKRRVRNDTFNHDGKKAVEEDPSILKVGPTVFDPYSKSYRAQMQNSDNEEEEEVPHLRKEVKEYFKDYLETLVFQQTVPWTISTWWDTCALYTSVTVPRIQARYQDFEARYKDFRGYENMLQYAQAWEAFEFDRNFTKSPVYFYHMEKDQKGVIAHFRDMATFQSAHYLLDQLDEDYAEFYSTYPDFLDELGANVFTCVPVLKTYGLSTVARALIACKIAQECTRLETTGYYKIPNLFFQNEIKEFERTVIKVTEEDYHFPHAVDFGSYQVSADMAAMALFTRVYPETQNFKSIRKTWKPIVDVERAKYDNWKKGTLCAAVGLISAAVIGTLIWKFFCAGIDAVVAESYDKGNASRDRLVRRKHRYNKSRVTRIPKCKGQKLVEKMVAEQGDDDGYDAQYGTEESNVLANKVIMNSCEMEITFKDGTTTCTLIFFVTGTIGFVAGHTIDGGEIENLSLVARKGAESSYSFSSKQIHVTKFPDRDLARIIFDTSLRPFKKLSTHLRPFEDKAIVTAPARLEWDIYGDKEYRTFIRGTRAQALTQKRDTVKKVGSKEKRYINTKYYIVENCEGFGGACGYPYFDSNPKAEKRIFGIHIGGLGDTSMVSPILEEDLILPPEMDIICQAGYALDGGIPKEEYVLVPDVNPPGMPNEGKPAFNVVPYQKGIRYEVVPKTRPYMPTKTALKPSPIQNGIKMWSNGKETILPCPYLVTKKPAILGSVEKPTPLNIAMDKYTVIQSPALSKDILYILDDDRIFDGICSRRVLALPRRKLSLEEVVLGVPDLGIKPMDLSTSLGYPFTIYKYRTCDMIQVQCFYMNRWVPITPQLEAMNLQKRVFFHPFFLQVYEDMVQTLKRGEIPYYIVNDTLKDELRDVERVEKKSTRLFDVGSKIVVVFLKQYFGHLYIDIEHDRMNSDIKVGINVHSCEWQQEYERQAALLKSRKDRGVFAGDFERWDKTLGNAICSRIDKWEVNNIGFELEQWEREALLLCGRAVHSAIHNSPLGLYQVNQGQSSGHYKTTMRNSMYNSVLHRLVYNLNAPLEYQWRFDDFVKLAVYGDDAHGTVKKQARSWFNMHIIKAVVGKYFGMGYTDPNKMAEFPEFLTFDESSFLKRKFALLNKVDRTWIMPQLEPESIKNSILWMESKRTEQMEFEALYQSCESAMIEWFYHGEKAYHNNYDIIKERMDVLCRYRNSGKPHFYVLSYRERWHSWVEQFQLQ